MSKILVVNGSVREKRAADKVVGLVFDELKKHPEVEATLADFKELDLPFYDEPVNPSSEGFVPKSPSAQKWMQMVTEADGVIIVTPEYNHGLSGVLKNAIDWLYHPWKEKPVSLVGYGWHGAPFAIKHLHDILPHIGAKLLPTITGLSFTKEIELDGAHLHEDATHAIKATVDELLAHKA